MSHVQSYRQTNFTQVS